MIENHEIFHGFPQKCLIFFKELHCHEWAIPNEVPSKKCISGLSDEPIYGKLWVQGHLTYHQEPETFERLDIGNSGFVKGPLSQFNVIPNDKFRN